MHDHKPLNRNLENKIDAEWGLLRMRRSAMSLGWFRNRIAL